ncbi:MAG: glycoside hydrolase family 97 catalytic domain-containing protein [Luteolibacter sp.]
MLNQIHRISSRDLKPLLGLCFLFANSSGVAAEPSALKSPDGKVQVAILPGERLRYTVKFGESTVVEPSALGVTIDDKDLGQNVAIRGKAEIKEINESYKTRGVHPSAVNRYRSAVVPMSSGEAKIPWQLEVRAYDDGVAYRYRVSGNGSHHINGESSSWQLPADTKIWHQDAKNRSYESRFTPDVVGKLAENQHIMAPAALKFPGATGYGLMTEANLIDYSDMSLASDGKNGFKAIFENNSNGWDHQGEIISPWRVMLLAPDLNTLVNSDLIKNLCPAPAPELANAAWIKPGRSIWHWLTGGGPKLEEQKTWIDGTHELGYEYYLIDDGWRTWNGGNDNAWKAMEELVKYAKTQDVKIWVWVGAGYVLKPEDREAYFVRCRKMGIVGVKVDFPKAANDTWVQWYDDVLRDAAKNELMVDFHGALKPTGRERTWPNEMSREAVAGREQGKSPALHDITLPFLRYVQGPADFTPTLFIPKRLNGSSFAHELSMAIVYTSPFLCMGDNPKNYLDSVAVDVIKALPPLWDETVVLPRSEIGEYAAFARRKGDQWFIGAINDLTPREETINLNFLGKGNYKLVELADDAARNDAFVRTERTVSSNDTLKLPLRKDGGYVAWLVPTSSVKK